MNRPTLCLFALSAALGCSSTLDGSHAFGVDSGVPRDVPPGVNPDGQDPFRPNDSGVIFVDGSFNPDAVSFEDAPVVDERYAYLYIGSYFAGGSESTYVQAEFRYHPRPEDPRCSYHGAGSWDVSVCDDSQEPVADPHPRPFPNAGLVTVRGGVEPVSLTPMTSTGQYTYFFQSEVVFPGPRTITVNGAGTSMVPAFNATLTVPPALVITSPPELISGAGIALDRTQNLTIAWLPNPTRSVQITLTSSTMVEGRARTVRLYQEFYGSSGTGVIPASALRDFASTVGQQPARLTVMPVTIQTLRVGTWPLQYTVVGRGVESSVTLR